MAQAKQSKAAAKPSRVAASGDTVRFAAQPEYIEQMKVKRPPTGEEYLTSPRGNRAIFIYRKQMMGVTTHPSFRDIASMIARFQDA